MKALRWWYELLLIEEKLRGILPEEQKLLDKLK